MSDLGNSVWNETDASNTTAAPDGAPEGMAPSGVNDVLRAHQGALKRWYNWTNPKTTAGTSTAYTLSYTVAPGALVDGMSHLVQFHTTNGATPTLNVNSLGAKAIYAYYNGTWAGVTAGEIPTDMICRVTYNSSSGVYRITSVSAAPGAMLPLRGFIGGLTISRNTVTPTTKLDVSAGSCTDSTNVRLLVAAAGSIDCTTTGANALDAGSLSTSTTYHVYVIAKADGTTAFLASTSASAPTMPSGYTYKRRIGSVLTNGSSQFRAFVQSGDRFTLDVPISDLNTTNPGTAAVTRTLTVPTGVVVTAWFSNWESNTSTNRNVLWTALDQTDTTPSDTLFSLRVNSPSFVAMSGEFYVKTNTSGQIRYRSDNSGASDGTVVATKGWLDRRGQDS